MNRRAFLIGVCGLAIVARVWVGAGLLSGGPNAFVMASDDGDAYDAMARWQAFGTPIVLTERMAGKWHLASDQPAEIESRWPAGYWLFLAAQYRIFGSADLSTVALQAFVGAGGVLAAYALAGQVFKNKPRAAALSGVAVALSSTGVVLSAALYAEAIYVPLLIGGLALAALSADSASRPTRAWLLAALAGALFGLAEVTRPLALAVLCATAVWLIWVRPRLVIYLVAGFALALGPFVAHDLATAGWPTLLFAGGTEALNDRVAAGESLPTRMAMLILGGWAPLGEPLLSTLPWAPVLGRIVEWLLVAVGGAWLLRSPRQPAMWLVVLAILAIVVPPLLIGQPLTRYRAPADPLFVIWLVAALAQVAAAMRRRTAIWRAPAPSRALVG